MSLRRTIACAAVVLAVPLVSSGTSACGFNEPTDQIYNPGEGVNGRDGSVDVLGALIVSGTDGAGTVVAGLSNNDEVNGDSLVEVTGAGDDQAITVETGGQAEVEAGGFYQLADEGEVTVSGDQVQPGMFVKLTFAFERGESVTLDVPVVVNSGDFADVPTI